MKLKLMFTKIMVIKHRTISDNYLDNGVTLAHFQSSGNIPERKIY